jgi:predicted nucleotidyltransferase
MLDNETIGRVVQGLRKYGATQVYVHGSWARQEARPDSDLDLVVGGIPASRFFRSIARVSRESHVTLDALPLESVNGLGVESTLMQGAVRVL